MNEKGVKRLVLNAGIFAAAMILTFLCVFWKQDLEKIMWYTQHLIDHLKKINKENEDNEKK